VDCEIRELTDDCLLRTACDGAKLDSEQSGAAQNLAHGKGLGVDDILLSGQRELAPDRVSVPECECILGT
jgi:hypothetical protein